MPGAVGWTVAAAALACVAVATCFPLYDPDLWQHLAVGRAIAELGRVPDTQLWSWPTYGAPDVNPSWGFRVLLWPWWAIGGVTGLFAFRIVLTLATFAVLLGVARRLGARGLAVLLVMVVAGLVWRQRTQLRPEMLPALLLAATLLILETRRRGGRDHTPWLIPILAAWSNVHLTPYLGLVLIAIHVVVGGEPAPGSRRRLAIVAVLAVAATLLNPYGWKAPWQPFQFFLFDRHDPIYRTIGELGPIDWRLNVRNGLPLLLAGWPLLALLRARRHGVDRVELATLVVFATFLLGGQRFVGSFALVAFPYLARDLDALLRDRALPPWLRPAGVRAAMVAVGCVLVCVPELSQRGLRPGVGLDLRLLPVAATDYMRANDVRGRGYNPFWFGGWLLWRFWPERDRLPFMDIHQAGTREDRALAAAAPADPRAWAALDAAHRFEWVLVQRAQGPWEVLTDVLDADTAFACVFMDDAAALYVRRGGRHAALAARDAYRVVPAGDAGTARLAAAMTDPARRAAARIELERAARSSERNATASSLLANLDLEERRWNDAALRLERALAVSEFTPHARTRLALVAIERGRPREALDHLDAAERGDGATGMIAFLRGRAWRALGDPERAAAAWREARDRDPRLPARDSLAALGR